MKRIVKRTMKEIMKEITKVGVRKIAMSAVISSIVFSFGGNVYADDLNGLEPPIEEVLTEETLAERHLTEEVLAEEALAEEPIDSEVTQHPDVIPEPEDYHIVSIWFNGSELEFGGILKDDYTYADFSDMQGAVNGIPGEIGQDDRVVTIDDRPFVPLRNFATEADLTIKWYGDRQAVVLKTKEYEENTKPEYPYYILANKSEFTVTVYEMDDFGEYSTVAREFKTAIGRTNYQTPVGKFSIIAKEEWHPWANNYYSKYCSQYEKGLYIHSPLYIGKDLNNVLQSSVDEIGSKATSGCLRTYLEECKWIYENCPIGTVLEIVN